MPPCPTVARLLRRTFAALLLALVPAFAQAAPPATVAAASDLRFALETIAKRYTDNGGQAVTLVFGSSGNFRQQIAQGAPFELFLSADEGYVLALAKDGYTVDEGVPYAIGRLVLFVPADGPLQADAELADLKAALADGRVQKLAIANPEHAPYGRAAREALTAAGLWEAAQPRLVLGENVAQAAQYVSTGAAQAGIVAYSLVKAPSLEKLGRYALLPADSHAPLRQRMVLLKNAGEAARAFYAHLQTPAARAVLREYGFVLPGE